MSIPDFVGHMSRNPLLIPNRYDIRITGPVQFDKGMSYNCIAANVPARSLATAERYIHGPTTKVPYVEIFDDLNMTFRLSADMIERQLIDKWIGLVGGEKYAAAYFDDIKGEVQLDIYHQNMEKMRTYTFFDAFPISISETGLSQEANDVSSVTVQFAYHHYSWK